MTHPLVIGYHLIWTVYGSWLPNDPRGSRSEAVYSDLLAELGALHHGRKAVQPTGLEVRRFYEQAADRLKHPLRTFDEQERVVAAEAFADVVGAERYTCYACAIMPDHVHNRIRKHRDTVEEMAEKLMDASRGRLVEYGRRAPDHPTWTAGRGWSVFLDVPADVRRTIGYIERNPIKIGLPAQRWPFLSEYDDWPLHPGHSPNSPYAKRLRALGRYP